MGILSTSTLVSALDPIKSPLNHHEIPLKIQIYQRLVGRPVLPLMRIPQAGQGLFDDLWHCDLWIPRAVKMGDTPLNYIINGLSFVLIIC